MKCAVVWSLAVLVACTCTTGPAEIDSEQTVVAPCVQLLHSPPGQWPKALPAVLALGAGAGPALTAVLREAPHAPGAPAVAAALGRVGDERCVDVLVSMLTVGPESTAAEAAIALGRLRAHRALNTLQSTMKRPSAPPLLRAAAASAILAIERDADALAFLCDLVLAATPAGRQRGLELGLAVDRPRWALERNLAITTLNGLAPEPLALDADAPWPHLVAGIARARTRFGLLPR